MTETLLQKAKKVKIERRDSFQLNDEHIELAVGWATGTISTGQICKVLNTRNYTPLVAKSLREGCRRGKIEIKMN